MKMNLLIYSLLFSGLSVFINGADPVELTEKNLERIVAENPSITDFDNLVLSEGGRLGGTHHSIVWKGVYNNNETVAVKIIWDQMAYNQEIDILKTLNATEDLYIEYHGIPKIYYYGKVLDDYYAIAMTLFEGTLRDLYKRQRKRLSDLSILTIFKQAVKTLEYLNERKVVHNDIKPENIFLLGSKVFISDFDLATLKDRYNRMGYTRRFASSNLFAGKSRHMMDDLESLVFSIWYVARVPRDRKCFFGEKEPEGYALHKSYISNKAKEKMLQKCKHFKNPIVRAAFEQICAVEMISQKHVPNYEGIINVLANAIDELNGNSEPHQIEWLKRANK